MRKGFILLLLMIVATTAPSAQRGGRGGASAEEKPGPWFNTPVPPPVSDPRKPVMKYDDAFGPLPTAFKHRPGKSDELLDAAALKQDQRRSSASRSRA